MAKAVRENPDKAFQKFKDKEGRGWPERWFIGCPGCYAHYKQTQPDLDDYALARLSMHCLNVRDVHKFVNRDPNNPTFEPSLMWNFTQSYICHSYIRNGMIQFLSDCTHPLVGQTVPLMEIEEDPN